MDIILFDDIFMEINKSLNLYEIFILSLTCKTLHTKFDVKKTIIQRINKRLKEDLICNINEFKDYLNNNGLVISGSYIIQCITNERWNSSDIDIYSITEHSNMNKLMEKCAYESNNYNFYNNKYIDTIHNYTQINKPMVQIMTLNMLKNDNDTNYRFIDKKSDSDKKIYNYIDMYYDFSICKNQYGIKDGVEYVYIKDLYGICYKEVIFNVGSSLKSSIDRVVKYRSRGYKFNLPNIKTFIKKYYRSTYAIQYNQHSDAHYYVDSIDIVPNKLIESIIRNTWVCNGECTFEKLYGESYNHLHSQHNGTRYLRISPKPYYSINKL